ncbi:MAG: radical SAM protein [Candidatus Omnitrophota bacterium]
MDNKAKIRQNVLYFFSKKINHPLCPPRNITLTLNYLCNQNCVMCDIKRQKFDKQFEITPQEIKNIIDEMVQMNIEELVLTGGEPFLYPGIFEVIEHAKAKKRKVVMITNGFYDEPLARKIMDSPVDHLQVSLDGSNASIYESVRQTPGSFDIVTGNIKRFVAAGKSVGATATIVRQNYQDLLNIAHLAKRLGCTRLALRPAHVSNADPQNHELRDCSFWIPKEELEILANACQKLEAFNKKTNFLDFCPGVSFLPQYFQKGHMNSAGSCFIGFTRLIISYDEKQSYGVWMCHDMIGDIRREKLKQIWRGRKARQVRKQVKRCRQSCLFPEIHEPHLRNLAAIFKNSND